ncbi:hypothetical protein BX666DRAFT_2022924 [Dichotomocladium elegans]|nr:hypothetical protein BX666DRAFT_2022924 [Dichotomocladium elegans]
MLVTASPSVPVTSTIIPTNATATSTSLPLSFSMASPSDIRLKDCTLGDIVCAQEWIARELGRIQQNTKPRHCHDHEALLQVIDDMSRFLQVPGYISATDTTATAAAEPATMMTTVHSRQKMPILRLTDMEHAWMRIVRYSQRHDTNRLQSHPSRLVLALDGIVSRRYLDGGKVENTEAAQHQLFSILFGQVQLTSQLVGPWKMICQWAKQLVLAQDWHIWMGYGLDTFIKAKERCHLTVEAGTIVTVICDPALSSDSPTSESSSSTPMSGTSRDYQIMLEQLQELMINSGSSNSTADTKPA